MLDSDYVSVCYYGEPGTGKTNHAAHLGKLGKTAFFMAEPGLKAGATKQRGIPLENIMDVRSVTCELMMDSFWKLKAKLDDEPNSYSGAVLDTLTNLIGKEVASIRKREYDAAVAAAEAAGEVYTGPTRNKTGGTWDVYGEVTDLMREVIENYTDLPMHLAFTAHVRRDEDEDDGSVRYGPAASPAIQQDTVAYFDMVLRCERKGEFFIAHTLPSEDGKYMAKDREGVLPTPIMNLPTMDRIIAYANGDLTEKNDPIQKAWVNSQKEK